jgi:hypothetical protein
MKTIGLCTHFSQSDDWALEYALRLARRHRWQLTVCHWLASPYKVRRDMVYADLFKLDQVARITPAILNQLDLQLREYYEPRLGDWTDVAFKICEGAYQVELLRCFRQHRLDLVVMGYQLPAEDQPANEQPLAEFVVGMHYPMIVVGMDGPDTFRLNHKALDMFDDLDLPEGRWQVLGTAALQSA